MTHLIARWATRLSGVRLFRYFGASLCALIADVSVFFSALALGVAAGPAAALGYSFGILVHWPLSSRAVFHQGAAPQGRQRWLQKSLFVMSALAGLALTTTIVTTGDWFGIHPGLAKLVAIAASFLSVYMLRAHVVFRAGTRT